MNVKWTQVFLQIVVAHIGTTPKSPRVASKQFCDDSFFYWYTFKRLKERAISYRAVEPVNLAAPLPSHSQVILGRLVQNWTSSDYTLCKWKTRGPCLTKSKYLHLQKQRL